MKTILYYLLVFLIFSTSAYSQNYTTVIPNQQHFFERDSLQNSGNIPRTSWSDIKVLYYDSTFVNGTTISHFSFHTYRDTTLNGTLPCLYENAPAWSGYEMQEMNNGQNIFFNYQNDTLRINTLAAINNSWHFYDSINGSFYLATVDSIVWMQLAGITDSVKCISLMAYDSLGNIKSGDPTNGTLLLLSKSNGFIKLIDFRDFPELIFRLHRRPIIQMPTVAQIYDFNINDEFEYSAYCNSNPPNYSYSKILAKTFNATNDTVIYQIHSIHESFTFSWVPVPHLDTTVVNDTGYVSYPYSNNPLYSVLPEQNNYLPDSTTLRNYSLTQDSTYNYRPVYSESTGYIFHQPGDSCYTINDFEPLVYSSFYSPGLGVVESISNETTVTGPYCRSGLIWYHVGNQYWGNPLPLVTGINQIAKSNTEVLLFPNPNNGIFTLEFSKNISADASIEVTNVIGELFFKGVLPSGQNKKEFHFNYLPAGIYTCRIISNESVIQKKFVVSN